MLAVAKEKECDGIAFRHGFGNDTGLEAESADAVICSQSFHWMEPESTLREVNRILRPGGVFATIDCDGRPGCSTGVRIAHTYRCMTRFDMEKELPDVRTPLSATRRSANLENMKVKRFFRYCREITFANTEHCTADRLISLLLSQGSLQTVLKLHPQRIESELQEFRSVIAGLFGLDEFSVDFCYRMRVAVK